MKPSDSYLLNAAWLDDSLSFLSVVLVDDDGGVTSSEKLRPLSFGSWLACDLMGLQILESDSTLDLDEETRQLAAFRWLHLAELESVKRMISSGAYRLAFWGPELPVVPDSMLAAFRVWRESWQACIAAASVRVLPKRGAGQLETPSAVIAPPLHCWRVEFLAGKTGLVRDFIRWELPAVQALQMIHHYLWFDNAWTVRAGSQEVMPSEEFAGLDLFALEAPVDDDSNVKVQQLGCGRVTPAEAAKSKPNTKDDHATK